MNVRVERLIDRNVVGVVRGTGDRSLPPVLLSAHFDGLGAGADGTFLPCAVDNAAGVALVLEVASRLAADPPARDVVVALLGGKEWGLRGSRDLVSSWSARDPWRSSTWTPWASAPCRSTW